MLNLDKSRRFYFIGIFLIIATTVAIIFHSLPNKESIAMTEKGRVMGISEQKIIMPLAIIIKDDEQEWRGVSELTEAKDIIKSLQVPLYPEDLVSAFPDPKLKIGSTITINRAPVVYLNDGGFEKELRTRKETFAELFQEKNILLNSLDKVSIPLNAKIESGIKVNIIRVGERTDEEEIIIPYETKEIADSNILKGRREVSQEGINGKRIRKYHLIYENGILKVKNLIFDEIVTPPKNKIIVYGTKIPVLSTDSGRCSWTWGSTASRRYKKGTKLRVINLANGRSVITIVGGWGPETWTGRILDLNASAFEQIASLSTGVIDIKLEELAE